MAGVGPAHHDTALRIEVVHDFGTTGHRCNRPSGSEGLCPSRQIRCDTVILRSSAEAHTEAAEHLIEHQHDVVTCRLLSDKAEPTRIGRDAALIEADRFE